jgi:hypothetical protein
MDRQGVRRDDIPLLCEGTQIDRSGFAQEQVDHSTTSVADEMIVPTGLGIESGSLLVHEEGPDPTLVDEAVKVAINGGETDPRQSFVNPLVDLMGDRVRVIPLESFEHLLQLARRTFTGGPPHRLTSTSGYRADRIDPLMEAVIKSTVSCQAVCERREKPATGAPHQSAKSPRRFLLTVPRESRATHGQDRRSPEKWDAANVVANVGGSQAGRRIAEFLSMNRVCCRTLMPEVSTGRAPLSFLGAYSGSGVTYTRMRLRWAGVQ